ncbi:MAG: hypothetical protein JWQ13_2932, partial [Ramlibacter sp.]|nr:hypothetical protein [Ramlibacter sp.]
MQKRTILQAAIAASLLAGAGLSVAQDNTPFKIGLIVPMTGP